MKLQVDSQGRYVFIWYSRIDKRNGYWAVGPVGKPFNRRRPLHWTVAVVELWRKGDRRP